MKYSKIIFGVSLLVLAAVMSAELEDYTVARQFVVSKVPTSRKVVALTFDDGPVKPTTSKILEVLKEKQVKATFFVVGEMAEKYPAIVLQEAKEGHEIGNHSYDHARLTQLNMEKINTELNRSEKIIEDIIVSRPKLFRPPEGKYNRNIVKLAQERGYAIILWSVDPADWKYPPVDELVGNVLKHVQPGSIILLHDGRNHSSTPEALTYIIDELKERGYEFVKVSELLEYR